MTDVAELIKKVRRIEIVASRAVNELFAGQYKSVFRGRGMEFSEAREYQAGDDIRSIDWNVTARAGKPFIKRFVEERELTILFLVDLSASGLFGKSRSKLEAAIEVAAMLMFSALKNNDKVGLLTFADQVINFYRPRKGKANVLHLIRELLGAQVAPGKTDIKSALNYVNRVQKRKAVVFLLSDFLVPELIGEESDNEEFWSIPDSMNVDHLLSTRSRVDSFLRFHAVSRGSGRSMNDLQRALSICARRHDLIAMTLSDPREREFPDVGLLVLEDAESGEYIEVDTGHPAVRRLLAERFGMVEDRIETSLQRCRIDQLAIDTEKDLLAGLRRFFKTREKRH